MSPQEKAAQRAQEIVLENKLAKAKVSMRPAQYFYAGVFAGNYGSDPQVKIKVQEC